MMAHAFGVAPEFIEEELSAFISAGKLHCKIDRINKYVESNRLADPRNALYAKVLKQGDLLLNRIQKLSRVIDV
jgi:26S proteasome regulatory subunit N7